MFSERKSFCQRQPTRATVMNQAPAVEHKRHRIQACSFFRGVVLVLQGGGALGAYQAGVYEAVHEAKIGVNWICGTSIGGINGALIAGNRTERYCGKIRATGNADRRA